MMDTSLRPTAMLVERGRANGTGIKKKKEGTTKPLVALLTIIASRFLFVLSLSKKAVLWCFSGWRAIAQLFHYLSSPFLSAAASPCLDCVRLAAVAGLAIQTSLITKEARLFVTLCGIACVCSALVWRLSWMLISIAIWNLRDKFNESTLTFYCNTSDFLLIWFV